MTRRPMTRRPRPVRRGARWSAGLLAAGLLGVPLLAAAVVGWAGAAQAASPKLSLALTARPAPRHPARVELIAQLARQQGAATGSRSGALEGVTVSFSVHVEEFSGSPLLTLGTATTNRAGQATLTYQPTWVGHQGLVASAASSSGTVLASAATSYTATSAAHLLAGSFEATRPDGAIGKVVVGVLLALVIAVWIVLVAVVVRVNRNLAGESS